jgi:hypothetical protein
MAEHPLADLAWRINSLLFDDKVRERFLGQCFEYLRLRSDTTREPPLPFTGGKYDCQGLRTLFISVNLG